MTFDGRAVQAPHDEQDTKSPNRTQRRKPDSAQHKWNDRNPKARWAQQALRSALRKGLIERQPCEWDGCGETNVDFHHPDYDRPIIGEWLCRKHHKARHRTEEPINR